MRRYRVLHCETCTTELTVDNYAAPIGDRMPTKCQECETTECAFCGLPGNDHESDDGDKVCIHCASGHQRMKWFATVGTPVHGPCNCEVA